MPTHTPNARTSHAEVPRDLHQILAEAEAARASQLASLPPSNGNLVAAAHRASVERILEEIRTARDRLASGLYGVCAGCGSTIPTERLELHLWATTCARCDDRLRF